MGGASFPTRRPYRPHKFVFARSILMTSLAFIFGVVPLVIATGAGAEMRQSLGVTVFFGMAGLTALVSFSRRSSMWLAVRWRGSERVGPALHPVDFALVAQDSRTEEALAGSARALFANAHARHRRSTALASREHRQNGHVITKEGPAQDASASRAPFRQQRLSHRVRAQAHDRRCRKYDNGRQVRLRRKRGTA